MNRKTPIIEGVRYDRDKNTFTLEFQHDDTTDVVELTNVGLELSEVFNQCFFFKYKFGDDVPSDVRAKFIEHIKFGKDINEKDLELFVKRAVDSLCNVIDMWNYNTVVYPQSLSNINRSMMSYLRMYGHPNFVSFEMVKVPPSEIRFDYGSYCRDVLDKTYFNGQMDVPRYTQKAKQEVISNIQVMMKEINKKDYFSIGRDIKVKYRKYLHNIFKFKTKEEEKTFKKIRVPNVLIIDDVKTSGASISFVIEKIRKVNPRAIIVVFSLIGKE